MKKIHITYQNPMRLGPCGHLRVKLPPYITEEFTVEDDQDVAVVLIKNPERGGIIGFFKFGLPQYILSTRIVKK